MTNLFAVCSYYYTLKWCICSTYFKSCCW